MSTIQFRPLGEILEIIQQIGFDISYAYDDLLFSSYNVFILRFDVSNQKQIWLHFNKDCQLEKRITIQEQLKKVSGKKFELLDGSLFSVQQLEGKEEIELKFF